MFDLATRSDKDVPDGPTCPACGEEIQVGDGDRFRLTLHDETDSTIHHSNWNLCTRCWERWLDVLDGEEWADRRLGDR